MTKNLLNIRKLNFIQSIPHHFFSSLYEILKNLLIDHFKEKTNSSKESDIGTYYDYKSRELVYLKNTLIFDFYYE